MAFQFSVSELTFGYRGEEYTLSINARLAVDLEKTIGMHPLTLAQRINASAIKGEIPPLGQMAEFFEFMLKRAGARNVSFDDVYGELFGGDDAASIGESVGELLGVFVPAFDGSDVDPKPSKKQKAGKK